MNAFVRVVAAAAGAAFVITEGLLTGPPSRAENKSEPAVQVAVIRAMNACFSAAIRVTGFLVAREEAVLTLDLPGQRVVEVLAAEGDRVTAGQTLARLTLQSREGPADPSGGKTATLRAPVAGVITRSTAVVGATTSPLMIEPLFRIAVDNEIELEAEVPSIHVPALASGQTARIEIGDNRDFSGRVRLVPAVINPRTQLGRARLSLERDPSLRIGMFARATIDANRSCGISIPYSAVRYRTEGASVQVVREDVIETRLVQIGLQSATDTEIRDGLREGDMVVANANSSLRNGDKVRPIIADPARAERR
jgi:multidrug efflux pump subunit AcrA (membrane-fusion protein)